MAVVNLEGGSFIPYESGRTFGAVGSYERLDTAVDYAVDPDAGVNAEIVDLALADRGDDGLVHFRGDAVVLRPVDRERANGVVLLDVPNRGHPRTTGLFNRADPEATPGLRIPPGDGFLMEQGFTLAWVGWQWDVPRGPARLGLDAPLITTSAPGWMQLRYQLPTDTAVVPLTDQHVGPLGAHKPIPPATHDDPDAVLYVRDRLDEQPSLVPRRRWRFTAKAELAIDGGLRAGRVYDLVYRVGDHHVVGAGLLAARDLARFLRSNRPDNPVAEWADRLVITGISQNSRFLRHLLWLGLDVDEAGERAIDGVLGVVGGGRRGEFNHRYAQPSVQPTPSFGHLFPFADLPQTDPLTTNTAGLLDRVAGRPDPPKVMFANSSTEYWRGDASLAHTSVADGSDVEGAPFVRHYLFSGTQHGPGKAEIETRTLQGSRGANPLNLIDYRPLYRCALMNLVAWINDGVEPPASAVPRWIDGTAAERSEVLATLAAIPSMRVADVDALAVMRSIDLGPESEVSRGVGRYPAEASSDPYPTCVSAVDTDGNELAGVSMPDVAVPIATHVGFNPRHQETGGTGQVIEYFGSSVAFSRTAEERVAAGDPRPSIEERYRSLDDYLDQVHQAAQQLVADRRLLPGDVMLCVELARRRYELVMAEQDPTTPLG